MSRHPEVKWAQRVDKVFITVLLPDAKDAKVNIDHDGVFTFSATAGADNSLYELKLELFDKINVEESKINTGVRSIFCILEKAEKAWWKKLLRGDGKPPHNVKVDWDKWVDEDEDNSGPNGLGGDMDFSGMDFSNLANMGGLGGLGGMGGMGGLGGMGGMGGLGGMGGMGDDALGEDFDDSDDEEEVAKPDDNPAVKNEGVSSEEKKEAAAST